MDFFEFAQYLMNGGGSIMAASWLLERWGYFKIQDPSRKEDIFFGVATLIGFGAYALLTFAPAFMVLAQPYFIILAGIPPITTSLGKTPETTAPAATTELSPIKVFFKMVTLLPIHTFLPIRILPISPNCLLLFGSIPWASKSMIVTYWPISVLSPTST